MSCNTILVHVMHILTLQLLFFCKIQDAPNEILQLKKENIALKWALAQAEYASKTHSAPEDDVNCSFFKVPIIDDEGEPQVTSAPDIVAAAVSEAHKPCRKEM